MQGVTAARAMGEADLLRRWEGGQATYCSRRGALPETAGCTITLLRRPQQTNPLFCLDCLGPIQEGSQPGPRLDRKARVGKDPKAHPRYMRNQACMCVCVCVSLCLCLCVCVSVCV